MEMPNYHQETGFNLFELDFELELIKMMANLCPTEPNILLDLYMTYPHFEISAIEVSGQ